MKYIQTSHAPSWYNSNADFQYYSVTHGTSPYNQFYEFENEEEIVRCVKAFERQSFVDCMIWIGSDLFYVEDVDWEGDNPKARPGAFKNDWQAAFEYESPF